MTHEEKQREKIVGEAEDRRKKRQRNENGGRDERASHQSLAL